MNNEHRNALASLLAQRLREDPLVDSFTGEEHAWIEDALETLARIVEAEDFQTIGESE